MSEPKLPTPDEVAKQSEEGKKPKKESKEEEGQKYDGGEIPKQ